MFDQINAVVLAKNAVGKTKKAEKNLFENGPERRRKLRQTKLKNYYSYFWPGVKLTVQVEGDTISSEEGEKKVGVMPTFFIIE